MSQYAIVRCPQWQDLDEAGRKEFWASLALRHCRGIGPRTQAALVKRFGSAYQGVIDAVNAGTLTEERINESVGRILKIKLEME